MKQAMFIGLHRGGATAALLWALAAGGAGPVPHAARAAESGENGYAPEAVVSEEAMPKRAAVVVT